MGNLPKIIKLSTHAKQRLEERKDSNDIYNTKNLMHSSFRWYGIDDLIPKSDLYLHCLYVCRKSKQMGYITDGKVEVIYNKNTKVAITVMEIKEKFLPFTQHIKPEVLKQIEIKKKNKKINNTLNLEYCPTINNEKGTNYIEEPVEGFQELYTTLVSEIVNYMSNFQYPLLEFLSKNEQPYNIVYKKENKKIMTINELFGTNKNVYEGAIKK